MDATERARLRALCEGIAMPWEAVEDYCDDDEAARFVVLCPHGDTDDRDTVAIIDMGHDTECDEAHAALIVGAVNALPALIEDSERLAKAERERDEAVAMLRNLLARVHRDGGQHSGAVGLAQATRDADEIIARDFAELARLRAPRPSAIVLRPVDPMTARGLPCACDEWGPGHLDGCPNGDAEPTDTPVPWDDEDLALADGDRRALDVVTRERDEARAEVERLRTEVAAAVVVERETCAVICENAAGAEASMGDAERAEGDDEHADARMTRASALRQVARAIRARGAGGAR